MAVRTWIGLWLGLAVPAVGYAQSPPYTLRDDGAADATVAAIEPSDGSPDPETAPEIDVDATLRNPRRFDEGTWALQIRGSWYEDYNNSNVTFFSGAAALGYYFADRWALNGELGVYAIEDGYPDEEGVAMGSFCLQLRHHFFVRDRLSLYIDGGAGVRMADEEFPTYPPPRQGSEFGYILRAGVGTTYRIGERCHLMAGLEWFHISNARSYLDNPPTDGLNWYAGAMFTW